MSDGGFCHYCRKANCVCGSETGAKAEQFPMPTLADVLCNACQLLDAVKADWQKEGCWSDWDQDVRNGLSRELKKELDNAKKAAH